MDAEEVTSLLHEGTPFLNIKKNIPVTLTVKKNTGLWSFQGSASTAGLKVKTNRYSFGPGFKTDKVLFNLTWEPNIRISFKPVTIHLENSILTANGLFNLKDMDSLYLKLTSNNLLIDDLKFTLFKKNIPLKGTVSANLNINYSISNPQRTSVHGKIIAKDIF